MKKEDVLKQTIQLVLTYHGHSINVELKKHKTLLDVKQKIFNLFFPIKHDINIYVNNKNLESLNTRPIGYIFSGQTLVNLKVVDVDENNTPFKINKRFQDSSNKTNNLMVNFSKNTLFFHKRGNKINSSENNKSSKRHNKSVMLNKNKLLLLKTDLYKNNISINYTDKTKRLYNRCSVDTINTKQFSTKIMKLPPIHQKNPKNHKNNIIIVYNKCNECYISNISIYCRICNKFLCNNCALNKKGYHIIHKGDFIILVQDSNKANIKLYKNIINMQLKDSLSFFNNIGKNKKENKYEENKNNENNNNNNFNYIEIIINISNKIYKLVDQTTEMNNSLKEIDNNQTEDNLKSQKIEQICENEKNILKNLNVYEYMSPFQPFFILNVYEKNMIKYFNEYGVKNDERKYIKNQIELLFENIENEVDNALMEIDKILGDKDIII